MKSLGHYSNRKHRSNPSTTLVKPHIEMMASSRGDTLNSSLDSLYTHTSFPFYICLDIVLACCWFRNSLRSAEGTSNRVLQT